MHDATQNIDCCTKDRGTKGHSDIGVNMGMKRKANGTIGEPDWTQRDTVNVLDYIMMTTTVFTNNQPDSVRIELALSMVGWDEGWKWSLSKQTVSRIRTNVIYTHFWVNAEVVKGWSCTQASGTNTWDETDSKMLFWQSQRPIKNLEAGIHTWFSIEWHNAMSNVSNMSRWQTVHCTQGDRLTKQLKCVDVGELKDFVRCNRAKNDN